MVKRSASLLLSLFPLFVAPFGLLRSSKDATGGTPFLPETQLRTCTDSRTECKRWARDGECENNPVYMAENCRASCLECQSHDCFDQREECESWADAGECAKNSDFMMEVCKYSCAVCNVNFKASCKRDPKEPPAAVAGTIDETFRRALEIYPEYRPRVLHRDPWIVEFQEFLQPHEVDVLKKVAGHNFERSLAGDGVTPVRTSSTSWCNVQHCLKDETIQTVRERISNVTRVPWENAEHLQVLRYHPGQFYREHHDQNSPRYSAWGPRLYTFFMYLSDRDDTGLEGGETRFTKLNISVTPKRGSAILWPSVHSDNPWETEDKTYHEAVTVSKGEKYAANFWIHMFEFQKMLQNGCDNEDYFQEFMMDNATGRIAGKARPKRRDGTRPGKN